MEEADRVARVLTAVGASVGMPPGNDRESVDNTPSREVLGKSGNAVTELRDVLGSVGIAMDVLRSFSAPENDSVGKLGDSIGKFSDSTAEL